MESAVWSLSQCAAESVGDVNWSTVKCEWVSRKTFRFLTGFHRPQWDSLLHCSPQETISVFNALYRGERQLDSRADSLKAALVLASTSMFSYLNNKTTNKSLSVMDLWIEQSDLLNCLHDIFDDSHEVNNDDISANKKLGLDLGFVLLSASLSFHDDSFGLLAPLSPARVSLVSLFAKYLESFMVTEPTHYPFMPEQYYATIHWPMRTTDSCSGKIHSLITFQHIVHGLNTILSESESGDESEKAKDLSESATAEVSSEPSPSAKRYCNYSSLSRRQPWRDSIATSQLLWLVYQLLSTRDCLDRQTKDKDVDHCFSGPSIVQVLRQYEEILRRIVSCDRGLVAFTSKNKKKSNRVAFKEQSRCACCDTEVQSRLQQWTRGPLSIFTRTSSAVAEDGDDSRSQASTVTCGSTSTNGTAEEVRENSRHRGKSTTKPSLRHHCRLCLQSVCSHCLDERLFDGEKTCVACREAIDAMHIEDLLVNPKGESSKGNAAIALLSGEPALDNMGTTDAALGSADDDGESLFGVCCSMLLPPGLRDWRDLDFEEEP